LADFVVFRDSHDQPVTSGVLPAEVLQNSHVELEEPKRVQPLGRKKFGCKSTKSVMSLH
jgi:hypothetical protein